jgi:hypothetical protein
MERRKRSTLTRKKRAQLRKKKIRRRITIFALLIIIISIGIGYVIRGQIIASKCKDLYYATDYYMTSGAFNSNKLLRVKTMKLVFADKDSAIVETQGLYYKHPYATTTYKAFFKKNSNDSWTLEKTIQIDNSSFDKDAIDTNSTAENIPSSQGSN